MNLRIQKLAEQAGMTNDKFGMYFAKDFDSHCADGVDLEKFAELIIKECADVAADQSAIKPEFRIRKHFGVEE